MHRYFVQVYALSQGNLIFYLLFPPTRIIILFFLCRDYYNLKCFLCLLIIFTVLQS